MIALLPGLRQSVLTPQRLISSCFDFRVRRFITPTVGSSRPQTVARLVLRHGFRDTHAYELSHRLPTREQTELGP